MVNEDSIFSKFPELDIDRNIVLRQINLKDLDDFYSYIAAKEVTKFLSDPEIPSNLEEAEVELMYWANLYIRRRSVYWGVCDKNTGKLIGTSGFNSWSKYHQRAEISYDLSHHYWNKGIMTKVVEIISDYGFRVMQLKRIQATVVHYNIGSSKVLEKCGYDMEGELKNYGKLHGKSESFYMYSSTKK